jgi:hypothetical protein
MRFEDLNFLLFGVSLWINGIAIGNIMTNLGWLS